MEMGRTNAMEAADIPLRWQSQSRRITILLGLPFYFPLIEAPVTKTRNPNHLVGIYLFWLLLKSISDKWERIKKKNPN